MLTLVTLITDADRDTDAYAYSSANSYLNYDMGYSISSLLHSERPANYRAVTYLTSPILFRSIPDIFQFVGQ